MEFLTPSHGAAPSAAARRWIAWIAGLALLCCGAPRGLAQGAISDEYQVKAVFLFNFAQFAEWPERAFATKTAPLAIGILGDDPFGSYLDELVRGEKVGDRPLEVRRYRRGETIVDCQILFVSRSEGGRLGRIVAQLEHRPVLTISDLDTFTRYGGMVRFATENGKIRLKINLEAARACGLTISSKIIRPGTIVSAAKN